VHIKQEIVVDKNAVKDHLKNNGECTWASLVQTERVDLK